MAMARANDSRVQPISWVMGSSHRPNPWRMPMDRVTMAAGSTWNMDVWEDSSFQNVARDETAVL